MRRVLGPRPEMQHRDELTDRIDGHPKPQYMRATPEPRAQFLQLDVGEMEVRQPARKERGTVLACTGHPGGDGRLPMPKHAQRSSDAETFRQRREHVTHPL